MPLRAQRFRRQTELIAKGACESFVGVVTGVEGEGQDIRRAASVSRRART